MRLKEMYRAIDFESITVATTALGLTATKIDPISGGQVIGATISAETAQMRYTVDGTTVNASTNGHLLEVGDIVEIWGGNDLAGFSAIRTGATSGTLKATYYQA